MAEFILLMHADTVSQEQEADWDRYISTLNATGKFRGGSSIGGGEPFCKSGVPEPGSQLTGYLRIEAYDLNEARSSLQGNPTYEAGGTVSVRELVSS
jgi:hypothetical protein